MMPRIAFLGTGLMGAPMAANLIKGIISMSMHIRKKLSIL